MYITNHNNAQEHNQVKRSLKFLHQMLSDGPHTGPFAVDIEGNREKHQCKMYATQCNEDIFSSVCLEPLDKKERENESMKHVYSNH